jgi:hypothetical protein
MMHRKWFAVAAAAANVQSFWISPFINLDLKQSIPNQRTVFKSKKNYLLFLMELVPSLILNVDKKEEKD